MIWIVWSSHEQSNHSMLHHQDHFLRASCQHSATFEKLGNGVSNGIFIGFMKLDAQHTSPVLPSLATKYFHLLLVSFWASLPSARLLPQRGLLVELECNYQSFELRKLSRFLFSMLGQKKVEQTWRWWFKLHPCCFSIFQVNEFQPTWWEMLCMISRGWPPQGLRKVASVSEPPKLAHCTHVAAGGHGHFQVSWINRGSWFFQSPTVCIKSNETSLFSVLPIAHVGVVSQQLWSSGSRNESRGCLVLVLGNWKHPVQFKSIPFLTFKCRFGRHVEFPIQLAKVEYPLPQLHQFKKDSAGGSTDRRKEGWGAIRRSLQCAKFTVEMLPCNGCWND